MPGPGSHSQALSNALQDERLALQGYHSAAGVGGKEKTRLPIDHAVGWKDTELGDRPAAQPDSRVSPPLERVLALLTGLTDWDGAESLDLFYFVFKFLVTL